MELIIQICLVMKLLKWEAKHILNELKCGQRRSLKKKNVKKERTIIVFVLQFNNPID